MSRKEKEVDKNSTPTPKKKKSRKGIRGRPSKYTPELGERVCDAVAAGKTLDEVQKLAGVSKETICQWIVRDREFAERFMDARRGRAHWRAEEMDRIVDDVLADRVGWQAARVALEHHRWAAGKEDPKVFNDKVQAEITGKDGKDLIPDNNRSRNERVLNVAHSVAHMLALAKREQDERTIDIIDVEATEATPASTAGSTDD